MPAVTICWPEIQANVVYMSPAEMARLVLQEMIITRCKSWIMFPSKIQFSLLLLSQIAYPSTDIVFSRKGNGSG